MPNVTRRVEQDVSVAQLDKELREWVAAQPARGCTIGGEEVVVGDLLEIPEGVAPPGMPPIVPGTHVVVVDTLPHTGTIFCAAFLQGHEQPALVALNVDMCSAKVTPRGKRR